MWVIYKFLYFRLKALKEVPRCINIIGADYYDYRDPMIENLIDSKNTIKKSHMDSALGTALHILRCIDEDQSTKEIIQSLDNNEQLVSVWIQYLKAISWLKEDTQ